MTIQSGFFNSVNGDRKYDASFFASYFASFIGNGVFPNPSTNLQVVEGDNMTTVIKVGRCWINGYILFNKSDYVLEHDNADGVLKRIDRIVARWDASLRDIILIVKKGSFASNPVPPALQRDADAYELALADVLINAGATQITQANITDQRLNGELCGIVSQTVKSVDTTTLFNQYQSWFNQTTEKSEQEFSDWFEHLKNTLEGDVATALYLEIERAEKRAKDYTDTAPELMLQNIGRFETAKSDKDNRGNFHKVEKRRDDGTLFEKSEFSDLNEDNNPLVRTVTTYDANGVNVINVTVFDLYYDDDGDFVREVPR